MRCWHRHDRADASSAPHQRSDACVFLGSELLLQQRVRVPELGEGGRGAVMRSTRLLELLVEVERLCARLVAVSQQALHLGFERRHPSGRLVSRLGGRCPARALESVETAGVWGGAREARPGCHTAAGCTSTDHGTQRSSCKVEGQACRLSRTRAAAWPRPSQPARPVSPRALRSRSGLPPSRCRAASGATQSAPRRPRERALCARRRLAPWQSALRAPRALRPALSISARAHTSVEAPASTQTRFAKSRTAAGVPLAPRRAFCCSGRPSSRCLCPALQGAPRAASPCAPALPCQFAPARGGE